MAREDIDPADLLQQHRRLAARLTRRYGRSDAEDLASEALARTLRRPVPQEAAHPWIERILRNLVVDRARRSGRAATHAATLACISTGAPPTPEEHLLRDERCRAVQEALPSLPTKLRDAVLGRFYEERDYDGVAASRGISPATARTRVHRALASLRASLGRLRTALPVPQLLAPPPFAAPAALLPAALSAALIAPTLASSPVPLSTVDVGAMVFAQASPRTRSARAPATLAESPAHAVASAEDAPTAKPIRNAAVRTAAPTRPPTAAHPAGPDDRPAAVSRYDYDDDMVEGDLARPDGDPVFGDPTARHASLIEIRTDFLAELAKTLEDL